SQFGFAVKTQEKSDDGKKYFTLAEAKRALPLVKRIASDIQSTQSQRLKIHAQLSAGLADLAPAAQAMLQGDFDRATDRLEWLIEGISVWILGWGFLRWWRFVRRGRGWRGRSWGSSSGVCRVRWRGRWGRRCRILRRRW